MRAEPLLRKLWLTRGLRLCRHPLRLLMHEVAWFFFIGLLAQACS